MIINKVVYTLYIGECSFISGVKLGNSLDQYGRERFHTLGRYQEIKSN